LTRSRVDRFDAVEKVLKARRPEQHCERGVVLARRVRGDEPGRERLLRATEVGTRDDELVPVLALVVLDLREPDVREVVRLDGRAELCVDLLDLPQNLPRLRLLRRDRAGIGGRARGTQEGNGDGREACLRLSSSGGGHLGLGARLGATRRGRAVTSGAP
jgi:hypothetical protein